MGAVADEYSVIAHDAVLFELLELFKERFDIDNCAAAYQIDAVGICESKSARNDVIVKGLPV